MKAVCLFDIDGTLLTTGGAGQLAMERALARVFGLTEIRGEILSAGRTDRAITADLFREHRIDATPEQLTRFLSEYLSHLPVTMQELGGRLLPGVEPLLAALAGRGDIAIGLLTGNYRDGAKLKLRHFRIDHHFGFGAYGDDHHDRDDVARVAFAEAVRYLRREVDPRDVWVLGDTPSDVRCARAIGANAVAVATGVFSHEQLQQAQPDLLFDDFSDVTDLLGRIMR